MVTNPTRTIPKMSYEGQAAEDIEPNSVVLKIICPELTPNVTQGSLGAGISNSTATLKNRDGGTINVPVVNTNHVVATWDGSSNMRYPPMVRKGEPVKVYKYANQDKYFWSTTGKGRDFRTTDRVVFEVAAIDPEKPRSEKDDTNTYSAYLDSHDQKVGFKTSQANGEVTALSMMGDLKEGTFHLSDNTPGVANRIFLDSGAKSGVPVIQLNLSSGAVIKMEGDNIYIKVPKKLFIDVGERFIINSPLTIFNISKVGTVIINASSVAVNAVKSFVVSAATIGLNGATKVGGVFVAASARIANAVKGSAGSEYTPASVSRPIESPVTEGSNSPDTSMSGIDYKTT